MTADEIRTMPAGRKLDAIVAELVMGWTDTGTDGVSTYGLPPSPNLQDIYHKHNSAGNGLFHVPRFSTDIAAAWLVWEWLTRQFTNVALYAYDRDRHRVLCWGIDESGNSYNVVSGGGAESVPVAICRAALMAVMEGKS